MSWGPFLGVLGCSPGIVPLGSGDHLEFTGMSGQLNPREPVDR